jgi:hypothetical protein
VTEQQRADGAMADEEDVARQHRLGLAHDPWSICIWDG